MTDTRSETTSIADRIRPLSVGAAVIAVHFLGDEPVFVLGEESLVFLCGSEDRGGVGPLSCWARSRSYSGVTPRSGAFRSMAARFSDRRRTESASSRAATTAR